MSRYTTLLLFIIAVAMVAAQQRNRQGGSREKLTWWTESKAHILSSKSFENLIGKERHALVQFCATFANECEQLAPEYNKLGEMYIGNSKNKDIFIAKIDGWTFNSLSQTYDVTTFPDIRFIPKGNASFSESYEGELTAEKMDEWLQAQIKKYEDEQNGKPAEEKKQDPPAAESHNEKSKESQSEPPRDAPRDTPKEAPRETPKSPSSSSNSNSARSSGDSQDPQKEWRLVLNTSLLQGQFEEVQNRLNKIHDELDRSVAEKFKKVEELDHSIAERFRKVEELHNTVHEQMRKIDHLNQVLDESKREHQSVKEHVMRHGDKIQEVLNNLHGHKEDIKSSITRHAEDHMSSLKDSVTHIKSKVYESKPEEPKGPGFTHNLIYIVIGSAIGGVIAYVAASSGNKKRRSMLD